MAGREWFTSFRGFHPDANKLISVSVLGSVGNTPIWFLFPLYLQFLEYTKIEIGWVILVMSLGGTLSLVPGGYAGDRYGRKMVALLGVIFNFIGVAIIIPADTLHMFMLGGVVWASGHSLYFPSLMAYTSEKVSEEKRKYLFSVQMFGAMTAGALSIFISGQFPTFISTHLSTSIRVGYQSFFVFSAVFILLQALPFSRISDYKVDSLNGSGMGPTKECVDEISEDGDEKEQTFISTIVKFCIPMVLLGLGAGLIVPFFQLYFVWRFNTPLSQIGVLFSITNFLWGIAYLVMPKFAERIGSVKAITIVQCIAIAALIGIPLAPSFHFVAGMYMIRMILMNSTWPVLSSYMLGQVEEKRRNITLSSTHFSFNISKSVTPGIAGYIYAADLDLPFYICAVFYTVATVVFLTFFRKRDDRSRDE